MQVVVTMGGLGQRFKDLGHHTPKPFIQVANKSIIQHLADSFPKDWPLYFVINKNFSEFDAQKNLKSFFPNSKIIFCDHSSRGPIDTVITALPHLGTKDPVLVTYCDYSLVWDSKDFANFIQDKHSDCAILGYHGFHPTYFGPNTYAHLKLDAENNVLDVQEKVLYGNDLLTEHTSCGAYYFKSVNFLEECLAEQIAQNLNYNGEFYLSLAIKAMMNKMNEQNNQKSLNQQKSKVHYYPISHFVQLGTPADTERFEFWHSVIKQNKNPKDFKFKFIPNEKIPLTFSKELYEKEKEYWQMCFL